ncbi:MAG: metallophosphoesterase family protein, partial [Roseibacillus sp.]
MRYAIFSDVHANRQAWKAVLADTLQQRADTLVCLGDVVGYGPKPLAVLTAVREVTPNFVLGNHDAAACGRLDSSIFNERARIVIEWTRDQLDEEALQFLEQVPLQMDGSEIQFVHAEVMEPGEFGYVDGIGPADMNLRAMTSPIGFLGHTHLPMAFTMPRKGGRVTQLPPLDFDVERGRRYLVNVGSVGEPRTTDVRASYVIYDDVERRVYYRKVAFDVEAYKADLAETGLDFRPYFVQVVDAGKVAGTPAPTPAPQMALAQPPKVAEVVAGHLGRLVLGTPGSTMATGARAGAVVAQPKSVSGWVIGAVVLLVLLLVGMGVKIAVSGNGNEDLTIVPDGGTTSGAEKPKKPGRDALVPRNPAQVAKDESAVPIK